MIKQFIFCTLILSSTLCPGQNLKRQAGWEFQISITSDGRAVATSIAPGSTVLKSGLKENDQILSINNISLTDRSTVAKAKSAIWENDLVTLTILRNKKQINVSFKAPAKPYEKLDGVESIFGEVKTTSNYYIRTITTKPKATQKKIPGIFFVSWLSCDPIEINPTNMDGWALLIQDLATKSGMAFMRAEKPGLGDSQGPKCSECDLHQDLAAFKAAFKAFKKMDFVDSTQIFVFGGSIGGALAPVLMQDENLKGIIVANTFGRTWFEHFLDFERTRLELAGKSFSEINESMKLFSEFYQEYLIQKKTPAGVIKSKPHLIDIWYDGPTSQFGRPSVYHHQVQQLNVPGAWQKINYPVLVLYGEYDWIMTRQEHEYIAHVVNSTHPGNAELKILKQMDHHFSVYKTPQEAFSGDYINYSKEVFPIIISWINSKLE